MNMANKFIETTPVGKDSFKEDLDFNINKLADIPIPTTEHLEKYTTRLHKTKIKKGSKYDTQYDIFCRWSGLPTEERKPKTKIAWERENHVPKDYSHWFTKRADFQKRRLGYFWEWMIDRLPDVVAAQLDKAIVKGDTQAAKFFAELIAPHLNIHKPQVKMQPFFLVGVPQENIDNLFIDDTLKGEEFLPENAYIEEEEEEEDENSPYKYTEKESLPSDVDGVKEDGEKI